jgi:tetratricopeptide (TPR) repeat protein
MRVLQYTVVSLALCAANGCGYLGLGADQTAAKFDKRLATARTMLACSDFPAARKEASAAAELLRKDKPNDPRIADALAAEGAAALGAQDAEAARERFEAALKLLEAHPDFTGPARTAALHGLGTALGHLGDLAAAEETLLRAQATLPKEKPDLAVRRDLHQDLATVYAWMGRPKQATAALESALDAERERQGYAGDSPELAALHCELGRVRLAAGDAAKAAESFDRANLVHKSLRLALPAAAANASRATLEESWLAVNAAMLVVKRGQPVHVAPLFEQALRNLNAESPDAPSPRRIVIQREYGAVLLKNGRPELAERALKVALADCQKVFGTKHPEVGRTLSAYAEVLDATRRSDEAERCRKRAGEIAATLVTFAQ